MARGVEEKDGARGGREGGRGEGCVNTKKHEGVKYKSWTAGKETVKNKRGIFKMPQINQPALLKFLETKNGMFFGKSLEIRDAIKDWLAYIPQSFPHYT
ncbi:MAG: hypothetical protein IMZ50_15670, partial [Candidatus Atribacteria bacterium]|nr:hypothetical protein [Candidatus Atribacteria bacterium]